MDKPIVIDLFSGKTYALGLSYNANIQQEHELLSEIKKLYEEVKKFDETTDDKDAFEELADVLEDVEDI
ncbi:hypothetical protein QUF56_02585 [Ureibacillus composti]|nr:hypothetical protein [Ureibacillus composti]